MLPIQWLAQPVGQWLTLTILHFIWQGLAIALFLFVIVQVFDLRQAADRYACSLAALIAMIASPLATFAWLALSASSEIRSAVHWAADPTVLEFAANRSRLE